MTADASSSTQPEGLRNARRRALVLGITPLVAMMVALVLIPLPDNPEDPPAQIIIAIAFNLFAAVAAFSLAEKLDRNKWVWSIATFFLYGVPAAVLSTKATAFAYADSARPLGDGECELEGCACGGSTIARGSGYLAVSQEFVNFYKFHEYGDLREELEMSGQLAMIKIRPKLLCEEAARQRGLDLELATADALHWWATGEVPLRVTPQVDDTTATTEPASTTKPTAPRVEQAAAPANQPICRRCQQPLPDEPVDPSDPLQRLTPPTYLGTVCNECGWVECYRCRGTVGAPCSECNGDVSPAWHRLFTS